MRAWVSLLSGAGLCLALGVTACKREAVPASPAPQPPASAPAAASAPVAPVEAKPGDQMTLSAKTLDGAVFDLSAQRGHWVVVNMWATWCGPCIEEMPELSALDAMNEDTKVIGLDMEDIPLPELNAFLKKHPVTYPIAAMDPASPPPSFGSVQFLPKTWLIDPGGKLAKVFAGPVNAALLRAEIDRLGASKAPGAPTGSEF